MIGVRPPEHDPSMPTRNSITLPVGSPATVRGYVRELARRHRGAFAVLLGVNTVAVVASMIGPFLLGDLVQDLADGHRDIHLTRTVCLFLAALAVQACFVRMVRLRGAVLGERMLADLREDFLVRSVSLPPGVLERAAPATCCRGSPPTSTGCRRRCGRRCRNSRSPWCGRCCCSEPSR